MGIALLQYLFFYSLNFFFVSTTITNTDIATWTIPKLIFECSPVCGLFFI